MENARLRECLASDFARLREVVGGTDPDAAVPSCPEWTVSDLAAHVAEVYLHKVECMARGVEPDPWPPEGLRDEAAKDAVGLLDRAYATLIHEFVTRPPDAPSAGWYAPDRTVGFWIRRMAQETVIHRIDAELAAGVALATVPDDLAVDGIDEFLNIFLAYGTATWNQWAREVLHGTEGDSVRLTTTGGTWLVRPTLEGVHVSAGATGHADAEVTAAPADLLRWVWGRDGDGAVTIDGDADRVARLRKVFTFVGQ
jgi:uncharacterized protein (TIGR03083 family)